MPKLMSCLIRAIAPALCCVSIVLAFHTSTVFAQAAAQWQRYNPQDEEFSVLLPDMPLSTAIQRPKLNSDRQHIMGRMYSAYSDGTAFIILSLDNPNNKDSLQDFVNEFKKDYPVYYERGKSDEEVKEVQAGGFKGRHYTFQSERVRYMARFYLTKERAYIFEVVSDKKNDEPFNQFFTSITLDKQGKALSSMSAAKAQGGMLVARAPATQEPAASETESVFKSKDLTRKAILVARPQPFYTKGARMNQTMGTVVLRVVLHSSGQVTNITVVKGLPDGLTEKAVAAARNVRFLPAVRDGKYVSQYVQIEYNFNLY